jgi:putative flippase GtrA
VRTRFLVEFSRFVFFGLSAVLIDFLVFNLSSLLGANPTFAKAIGYIAAVFFTLLFVVRFTFRRRLVGRDNIGIFFLYACTGLVNVLVFTYLRSFDWSSNQSFVFAVVASATLNFVGLKFLVNRARLSPKA